MIEEQLRKIDALVAEHVFGLKSNFMGQMFRGEYIEGILHYSTSISDAWEVVDKFKREGPYKLEIHAYVKDRLWTIKAYHPDGYSKSCTTSNASMPLCICLAALKAKGVDVKEFE